MLVSRAGVEKDDKKNVELISELAEALRGTTPSKGTNDGANNATRNPQDIALELTMEKNPDKIKQLKIELFDAYVKEEWAKDNW